MDTEEDRKLLSLIVQHLKQRGFLKAARKLEKHLSQVEELQYSLHDVYVGWMRTCAPAADSEKEEGLNQGGVTNGEETPSICGDLEPSSGAVTVQCDPSHFVPENGVPLTSDETDEDVLGHRPESVVLCLPSESEQEMTSQTKPVVQTPEGLSSEPEDSAQISAQDPSGPSDERPSDPACVAEVQDEEQQSSSAAPQSEPAETGAPPPADLDSTAETHDHQEAAEDQMVNSEASVEDQTAVEDAAAAEELGVLLTTEAGDRTAAEENAAEETAESHEDLQGLKKRKKKKRKSRAESESLSIDTATTPETLDSSMEKKTGEDELTEETVIAPSKKKGKKRKKEQEEEAICLCVVTEQDDEEAEVDELLSQEKKKKKRRRGGKKEMQCEEQPEDGDREPAMTLQKFPDETQKRSRKKPRLRRKMSLKERMMLKKDPSGRKRKVHLKEIQLVMDQPQKKKKMKKKVEGAVREHEVEGPTLVVMSSAKRKKKKQRLAQDSEDLTLSQCSPPVMPSPGTRTM